MFVGSLGWRIACVALIDIRTFDRLTGNLLDRLSQFADLCPTLLVGRSHQHV